MIQTIRLVLATVFVDRFLWAVLAASMVLKLAFLLAFPAAPKFDELDYVQIAEKLL